MKVASFLRPVQQDLAMVDEALLEAARVEFPLISMSLEAILSSGGKRIRPALLLLAAKFHNYNMEVLLPLAAGIEMLHTATLVHDDTIDHSIIRRGTPTLNSVVADGITILMGDYLFAQSAILSAKPGLPRVTSILARTLADICNGELRQIFGSRRIRQSKDEYHRRIYCKTAALFSASTEIGAVASGAPEEETTALMEYGRLVGMAFQIIDDILDFQAKPSDIGKPVGSDLRQGIVTLPVICFLEKCASNGSAPRLVEAVVEGSSAGEEDFQAVIDLVVGSGALEHAYAEARDFVARAKEHLTCLPDNEYRQILIDIADYVIERDR